MDTIRKLILGAALGAILTLTVPVIASTYATPTFQAAVRHGFIEGNPDYYANGQASNLEYAHAIMTALLRLDVKTSGCPTGTVETGYGNGALYVPNLPAKYLYYIAYDSSGERVRIWGPYPTPGSYPRVGASYGVCYAANG